MKDSFVVVVEPEIPENLGFIARLCSNFGWSLRVVNPHFNLGDARNTAVGCQEVLDSAEIFSNLENALQGLNFVVGTKPGRGVGLSDFDGVSYNRGGLGLVLGCESKGLSNDDLDLCDVVVHIETSGYDSLNLSHAASVLMYEFSRNEDSRSLSQGQKDFLSSLLGENSVVFELLLSSGIDRDSFDKVVEELKILEND